MKKNKSDNVYTTKWLRRFKNAWHEEHWNGIPIIILDKLDAPRIVVQCVKRINERRGYNGFDSTDEEIAAFFERDMDIPNNITMEHLKTFSNKKHPR